MATKKTEQKNEQNEYKLITRDERILTAYRMALTENEIFGKDGVLTNVDVVDYLSKDMISPETKMIGRMPYHLCSMGESIISMLTNFERDVEITEENVLQYCSPLHNYKMTRYSEMGSFERKPDVVFADSNAETLSGFVFRTKMLDESAFDDVILCEPWQVTAGEAENRVVIGNNLPYYVTAKAHMYLEPFYMRKVYRGTRLTAEDLYNVLSKKLNFYVVEETDMPSVEVS